MRQTPIAATLAVALVMPAQRSDTRALRARLADAAPLQAPEIAEVLQAARESIAYTTLRLSASLTGTPGLELLMDLDGRPKLIRATNGSMLAPWSPQQEMHRDLVTLTHYTRQAARYCDGSLAEGELVVEYQYERDRGVWSVSARRSLEALEPLAPIFDALTGDVALSDAGHGQMSGRAARHLTAPWRVREIHVDERPPGGGVPRMEVLPGGPLPPAAAQHLWIDEETMRPLGWSIAIAPSAAGATSVYWMFFVYDRSIELRPPDVQAPACVDPRRLPRPLGIR